MQNYIRLLDDVQEILQTNGTETQAPTYTQNIKNIWIDMAVVQFISLLMFGFLTLVFNLVKEFDGVLKERKKKYEDQDKKLAELLDSKETNEFFPWDYCIIFKVLEEGAPMPKMSMKRIVNQLAKGKLDYYLYHTVQRDEIYCKIRASKKRLEDIAEATNYKFLFDDGKLEAYCIKGRQTDKGWGPITIVDEKHQCDDYKPFQHIYGKFDRECYSRELYKTYATKGWETIFKGTDRLKLISSIISGKENDGCCQLLIQKLKARKWIVDFFPLHDYDALQDLQKKWLKLFQLPWKQPTDEIKNYFGEKIGLYFTFMEHYTTWLIIPAAAGVLTWVDIAYHSGTTTTKTLPAFSIIVSVWCTLFLEYWKRRQAEQSMLWGTTGFEEQEQDRPQFFGEQSRSVVDGSKEQYFSPTQSLIRKIFSNTISTTLSIVVIGVFISILLLRFVIQFVPLLTFRIYNMDFNIGSFLTSILTAFTIEITNWLYEKLALLLNDIENHRTDTAYEDALISKVFLFQFICSYSNLFYLAFLYYEIPGTYFNGKYAKSRQYCPHASCLGLLKSALSTILFSRMLLGNFFEVVLPYINEKASTDKADADADPARVKNRSNAEYQYMLDTYDTMLGTFGDYAEMVIQFGYTAMFAPAYPLVMYMALVNNYVEIRVDGWKLCQETRRPEPKGAEDIGTWFAILEIMSTIAVITNSAVIAFTSTVFSNYSWATRCFLFLATEHGVLLVKLLFASKVEDVSDSVAIQLDRNDFIVSKVINNIVDDDAENEDADDADGADESSLDIRKEDPSQWA